MRNKSDLQEVYEVHFYHLKKDNIYYHVSEHFEFSEKRTFSFPSVRTRKGEQIITIYKGNDVIATKCNIEVNESATERKDLIFKFLHETCGSLEDFECVIKYSEII